MKSNKIVLLLPLASMILLFVFGYFSLANDETITHLELQDYVNTDTTVNDNQIQLTWRWEQLPDGSLFGNDYIEIHFEDTTQVDYAKVTLFSRNEEIYSVREWIETGEDRIAIPFPTSMEDQNVFGPNGSVTVTFDESSEIESVDYVHTWMDVEVPKTDGPSLEERFEEAGMINYWRKRVDK
ncbi:hypothetical protein [Salisediminibacterium beveridgei]|uniref:Uncharacterized protein n=1 Tax=Salisediminibacterium beveridgei TaxID=632773 RepID=A0A1D7QUK4_9BACI|nr:hypothetical protein [Salisediminibacterium beveridgei]AOM82638.1 hypothetical protein BBEV_1273 [Salisediminibacterium beveridgei]